MIQSKNRDVHHFFDMAKIKKIKAREILNSRGNWTVEAGIETEQGVFFASVPSGTSEGKYEAMEIEPKKAVENIEKIIAPKLQGEDVSNQKKIDEILIALDGTENKSHLGANAILAVSLASLRAGAAAKRTSLYQYITEICQCSEVEPRDILLAPCFNILEGGVHAGNDLDIQEFMVVPSSESFKKNLQVGVEIYQHLKRILEKKLGKFAINVGYEGGFAPPIKKTKEALDFLMEAIKKSGYENKVQIGLDVAASEFFENGEYNFEGKKLTGEQLSKLLLSLAKQYPILFLEDPFNQDDWGSWEKISNLKSLRSSRSSQRGRPALPASRQNANLIIVGDDLTVTNPARIKLAKDKRACNSIVLKPNQIGTVSETITAAKLAKEYGWKIIVSHRSGDTCDDFIADLAVGINADFIKAGAPSRGERVAKYNRVLRIEEELFKK